MSVYELIESSETHLGAGGGGSVWGRAGAGAGT